MACTATSPVHRRPRDDKSPMTSQLRSAMTGKITAAKSIIDREQRKRLLKSQINAIKKLDGIDEPHKLTVNSASRELLMQMVELCRVECKWHQSADTEDEKRLQQELIEYKRKLLRKLHFLYHMYPKMYQSDLRERCDKHLPPRDMFEQAYRLWRFDHSCPLDPIATSAIPTTANGDDEKADASHKAESREFTHFELVHHIMRHVVRWIELDELFDAITNCFHNGFDLERLVSRLYRPKESERLLVMDILSVIHIRFPSSKSDFHARARPDALRDRIYNLLTESTIYSRCRHIGDASPEYGISEVLQLLVEIRTRSQETAQKRRDQLLNEVLLPLHDSPHLVEYHEALKLCSTALVAKEPHALRPLLYALLKRWSAALDPQKEQLFIAQAAALLEASHQSRPKFILEQTRGHQHQKILVTKGRRAKKAEPKNKDLKDAVEAIVELLCQSTRSPHSLVAHSALVAITENKAIQALCREPREFNCNAKVNSALQAVSGNLVNKEPRSRAGARYGKDPTDDTKGSKTAATGSHRSDRSFQAMRARKMKAQVQEKE